MKINIKNSALVTSRLITYNIRVIFGNKFVYFFAASMLFYLLVTSINLFSSDSVTPANIYSQLLFPGLLFIFFPTVFGIQNDANNRILEIVFGIPNYRYKVYLIRLLLILLLEWCYLVMLSSFSTFLLVDVPVFEMASRLMTPIVFFGMIGFAFSTVIRNGNGTVVILVIVGLSCWFLTNYLEESKWNVFLNPFAQSSDMSDNVWASVVSQNRTILLSVNAILLLWGLLNLQKREKFMR